MYSSGCEQKNNIFFRLKDDCNGILARGLDGFVLATKAVIQNDLPRTKLRDIDIGAIFYASASAVEVSQEAGGIRPGK